MMLSVQENGGFYIGRFEAGSTTPRIDGVANGTTEMVVKRDQYPYNYVGWGAAINDYTSPVKNHGNGAVYLSKHMYDGQDVEVTPTLCYGIQWDAMCNFINDSTHDVTNSKSWGNYQNNAWTIDRETAKFAIYSNSSLGNWQNISDETTKQKTKTKSDSILLTTGASDSFAAKNIFDVAGNCSEWTMEGCTSTSSTNYRIRRGRTPP